MGNINHSKLVNQKMVMRDLR